MNNQEWARDIKHFEWEELDGKTLKIRAGKQEGVMIVVGYDQETKDTFVLHEEFSTVPTIKPGDKGYRCGECHITSTAPEWNKTTSDFCNELNIQRIDDLPGALEGFYICPKCGTSIEYHDLEVIENG